MAASSLTLSEFDVRPISLAGDPAGLKPGGLVTV
ncbi:hypothetical protein BKA14_000908 [Actinoplanes abujensis]|uniref:Uncharacterized protein n=1 Tax=Paractinoplanes abujensis TaxID=882441 RepID=A0A7W7G041_9ACTN|nr:hypothetical protein [Actinoplanes abujensis]